MTGAIRLRRFSVLAILLSAGILQSNVAGQTGSGSFELISARPDGTPGGGQVYFDELPYDRGPQKISADNRFVVFASGSDQLVVGDANGQQDVFVRDRQTGTTAIVSRAFDGSPSNGPSGTPKISANGRYVAFVSLATNLVPGDTNGHPDVFVRDVQAGTTTRVSVSSSGGQANYGGSHPSISADGRYIAFASSAQDLVPPEMNLYNSDVFLRDTALGTTERVSVRADGSQIVGSDSFDPSISADGRRVAFVVNDNTLGGPTPTIPTNQHEGVYVRDLITNQLILVSARPDGTPASLLISLHPAISANGRYVSFTNWEDLDPNFQDAHLENDGPYADIFVRDLQTSITERVSLPFAGGPDEESGGLSTISADGRYVAYLNENLVRIRDRVADTTTVVMAAGGAVPDGYSEAPSISNDGRLVYFESYATNLVPNDTNGLLDAFVFSTGPTADLSLTLTASTLQPSVNQDLTFTVAVTNNGPNDATGVAVRAPLPSGLSFVSATGAYAGASGIWTIGSLAAGSTATLQLVGRFTATTTTTVTAQVSAASPADPDSIPDNDSPTEDDQRSVLLTPAIADLSLTLSANTTSPTVNANVTLTTTVSNAGPGGASGVAARIPLPGGLTFGSATPAAAYDSATGVWTVGAMPNGVTRTLQLVARVTNTTAVDAIAQVSASNEFDPDSTPDNSNAAEDDQATVRLTPVASDGIIVNDALAPVSATDGRCTLIEAIIAANTDLPSGNAIGECAGGNGPDTIYLRALNAPKDVLGIRDQYRLTAVHNTIDGPTGLPQISSDITIQGGTAEITRVGGPPFRIFAITPAGRLVLNDIAVSGGFLTTAATAWAAFGAGVLNRGILEVNNAYFSGNSALCDGGAIASNGPLIVRSSTFRFNATGCSGGAIQTFFAGRLTVADSTFVLNGASNGSGGGIFIHGTTTATVTNTVLDGNTARFDGGALLAHGPDANVAVIDSRITNNVSANYGGGLANGRLQPGNSVVVLVAGGLMTVTNSTVSGNRSTSSGGGIVNAGRLSVVGGAIAGNRIAAPVGFSCGAGVFSLDTVSLAGATVTSNTAENTAVGGGVCGYLRVAITDSTISSNVASSGGGLAFVSVQDGLLARSIVRGNQATGNGGGVFSQGFATLTLDDLLVEQNAATGNGGGIMSSGTTITARNNTRIVRNTATAQGGGISFFGPGTFTMTGGTIDGNLTNGLWSAVGGGGGLAINDASATVNLEDVIVVNNRAPAGGDGGGIFNRGTLNMTGGELRNNTAQGGGGLANGTSLMTGGTVTITDVAIEGNVASSVGGGIFTANPAGAAAGTLTMVGGSLRNNRAFDGGGLLTRPNSAATIRRALVNGNTATGAGGAIDSSGTLTVVDATFSSNSAGVGGAINTGALSTITGSTFTGNTASIATAIHVEASAGGLTSVTNLTNSTVSGNIETAGATLGAALAVFGRLNLHASTVVANVGSIAGLTNGGYVQIVDTILAGNRRPNGVFAECVSALGGAIWNYGGNLIGQDGVCLAAMPGAVNRAVDPALLTTVLGPLADNGGPTLTHALLPGSLALDGGLQCAADSDQRGEPRPFDADGDGNAICDIGAYEEQTLLASPLPAMATLAPASTAAGGASFTVTVNGSGFVAGSIAHWNGSPRTTFVASPTRLTMTLTAADLGTSEPVTTGLITVVNPGAVASNALPFTIVSAVVGQVRSQLAPPGGSATASIVPLLAGQAGVSATLTNNGIASSPATVTVATYSTDPVSGPIFAAGGFFDVQVIGADPGDSVAARFYYPSTLAGAAEAALQLQYWTGTAWAPVVGSGGTAAVKDVTNNLDGTVSGGRFAVTFDNTSTPRIIDLSGTVFALAATDTTAPMTVAMRSPMPNAKGWNNTNVTVTLTAADNDSGVAQTVFDINGRGWQTYSGPFVLATDGVYTIRFRSEDAAGNAEPIRTLTIRIDKAAPRIQVWALPHVLWPANGHFRDVFVYVDVDDSLSGESGFTLLSVESDEPVESSGDIVGWTIGAADWYGKLRAERSNRGDGRVYTLTYRGIDRAGNAATGAVRVIVPRHLK
jgi:uncharacterized repeat protein (TIGR01451 family)